MNRPEPKRPSGHVYNGAAYYKLDGKPSKDAAKAAWQRDWIRWARQEIKRLRNAAGQWQKIARWDEMARRHGPSAAHVNFGDRPKEPSSI